MTPLDLSRLVPIASWPGGELRICHNPAHSDRLEPAEPYVPYGIGYAIPARATWLQRDGVRLSIEYVDGALRLVGLEIVEYPDSYAARREELGMPSRTTTRHLTGKYLRGLPVDRRLAQAAEGLAVRLYRRPRGEVIGVNAHEAHVEQATADDDLAAFNEAGTYLNKLTADAIRETTPRRRGRRPVSGETLARAAAIAREADAAGTPRVRAIATGMSVAESTAKKYVRRAKDAGLMPALQRKGGNDG